MRKKNRRKKNRDNLVLESAILNVLQCAHCSASCSHNINSHGNGARRESCRAQNSYRLHSWDAQQSLVHSMSFLSVHSVT